MQARLRERSIVPSLPQLPPPLGSSFSTCISLWQGQVGAYYGPAVPLCWGDNHGLGGRTVTNTLPALSFLPLSPG